MLRIKNWSSMQSYKDRRPPWIRLHKTLLDDFEFHSMSVNARALLPMLWLLASEDEDPVSGLLRDGYEKIAFRLRMQKKDVESGISECVNSGFIERLNEQGEQVTGSLLIRNQTVTPETETEAYSTDREETEEALSLFNRCAETHGFSKVQKLTAARKSKLKLRLKEAGGIDGWIIALEKISVSDFCRGQNDRGWKADFDFLVTEGSFVKLMEGKYDNNKPEDKFKSQVRELAQNGW